MFSRPGEDRTRGGDGFEDLIGEKRRRAVSRKGAEVKHDTTINLGSLSAREAGF
jgi:hypothetical protein